MKSGFILAALPLVAISAPAVAGDTVRFEPAPAWVAPADFAAALENRQEVILFDRQLRLDNGTVTRFNDIAYDVRNAEILSRLGTLQFGWLPDKGDLSVHRLEIVRDGQVIDLIAQGIQPEVIRRETELERRTVNGALTALFKVPGLKIGDVLRFASSTTSRDQALGGAMQATEGLPAAPTKFGFARLRMSWPLDSGVRYSRLGAAPEPMVSDSDGWRTLDLTLPIAKVEDMPEDAPGRFKVSPAIMTGTFAAWSDVAATMAPYYTTEGAIAPGTPLAAEVERIAAASTDPVERAALALRSVQEEINYLMNGMDGGNYLPQSPAETWTLGYGDCKAKSLLLLAMLRKLGIEAEAALVNSDNGDAVSAWQPLPGAFDHVIVHATIGGTDYWLDGTGAGTRIDTMWEVPGFDYALPIRSSGATLVRMEQRWPRVADRTVRLTYDFSRGVDLPALYEIEVETRGILAARMASQASETDRRAILGNAQKYLDDVVDSVVYEAAYSYDPEKGTGRLKAKGIVLEPFAIERDVATHTIYTATTNWAFDPDRARAAWRDIPYRVGGPMTSAQEVTFRLPEADKRMTVTGEGDLAERIVAGTKMRRSLVREGNRVTVSDWSSYMPAEIAPAAIPEAKAAMRTLASADPKIRIEAPHRYWELDDAALGKAMAGLMVPADTLVRMLPDEAAYYQFRSALFAMGRNYPKALADIDKAIALDGTAAAYEARADVLRQAGRLAEAADAAGEAYRLKGDLASAAAYAGALALAGKADEGLAVLDTIDVSGEQMSEVAQVFAEVAGTTDRSEEGWRKLETALAERPGDGLLLNSQCWFVGTWRYRLDDGEKVCDKAVKAGDYSAAVLDSRALVFHRLGREDDALSDLDAALRKQLGQAASLYLRGIIRLDRGEAEGRRDIEQALRLAPDIGPRYRRYGIEPKR